MADTYEKDLSAKSSLTTSDYIRVVGSDNVSYKQSLLDVGAKGQIGQIGLLSDLNLDNFATNAIYGTWWLNCTDSAITGTKPASSGQGLLICKQQSSSIYRQVYVGVSGAEFKFRYYNNGSWTAWSNTALRAEVDAMKASYTLANEGNVSVASESASSIPWTEVHTVTPPSAGLYMIRVTLRYPSNSTGVRGCALAFDSSSSPYVNRQNIVPAVSGAPTYVIVTAFETLTASSALSVRAYQTSGSTLSTAVRVDWLKLKS